MSLTIEFAGIATLLWNKNAKEAAVVMVDLAGAGFHPHHVTLATSGGQGISCPDPDTSVAVPGQDVELGVWNLRGTEIELLADAGPLEVVDKDIGDGTKPPTTDNTDSIQWLPELGGLCQSRTLAPKVPLAARLPLKTGNIFATAAGHKPVRVVFDDNDERIGGDRYILPRFVVHVPTDKAILRLGNRQEFRFTADHHVIMSNICACEPATRGTPGHFYAHYLLVEAKRKPRIRRTYWEGQRFKPAPFAVPMDPEHCFCAYAMI